MKRLPNLDPLRFILASFVIFLHLPIYCKNQGLPYYDALPIFNRGGEAVRMFFVLSGFLIIRLIYISKAKNSFSIRKFYMRRVLRIFPLYFVILVIGLVFYNYVLPALGIPFENTYDLVDGILLSVFFLSNVFAFEYGPGGILEVLWSIGIEEQFYLMIAPFSYFIRYKYLFLSLVALTIIYFGVYHFSELSFLRAYNFVYFYLFMGGVVAILEEKQYLNILKTSFIIPLIFAILTVLSFTTDVFNFEVYWIKDLIQSVLFSLFIHTLAFNNRGVIIDNKALNYLGTISYGIYMLHFLAINTVVFSFMKIEPLLVFNDLITIILIFSSTFLITIVLAHLSYKYFESYFLGLKTKFRS
ncbi:MAG: peptidoglycan/LPS O-acetylase OafA/YrhL [Glaciecola sp.]